MGLLKRAKTSVLLMLGLSVAANLHAQDVLLDCSVDTKKLCHPLENYFSRKCDEFESSERIVITLADDEQGKSLQIRGTRANELDFLAMGPLSTNSQAYFGTFQRQNAKYSDNFTFTLNRVTGQLSLFAQFDSGYTPELPRVTVTVEGVCRKAEVAF